jgi:glycosyltransferase involved in cell wall biosynthesis
MTQPVHSGPLVSIVVFSSRTEGQPLELLDDLTRWLAGTPLDYELVVAMDGDQAELSRKVREKLTGLSRARVVVLNSRQGQLATLRAGIAASRGRYVVTFPAYPQVEASAVPAVLEKLEAGADYVVGYRADRRSSFFNMMVAGLFNRMVRYASATEFRDIACGTHGLKREIAASLPNYGDNQLYLPILAAREGYRVEEVALKQHPTAPRLRVFSPSTYLARALTLMTLAFLLRFTQKPLRPFGALGIILFLVGSITGLVMVWQRLFGHQRLADRPLLLLALLLVTAGIQVIILGLLGELLIYLHFRDQVRYRIGERAGGDEGGAT